MFTIPVGDGSNAEVDGPLDPRMPLVVLIPGFGATAADLTAPLSTRGSIAFDKTATFPPYTDAGFDVIPPVIPVAGWFADPPLAAVTSWRTALQGAGFSTVSYQPAAPGGVLAPNVTQLAAFAAGALSTDTRVNRLPVVLLGHSRGGLLARALVGGARTNPGLAGFLARVRAVVTLHSPHAGSGLAGAAVSVDGMLASLQSAVASLGLPPVPLLGTLRSMVLSPALAELAPGSPTLVALRPPEPVPGIEYHTFGGTSTVGLRLWQRVYTPDSYVPLPTPFPLFHRATTPLPFGNLLDAASFIPSQILLPLPLVTEAITLLGAVQAALPELRPGSGDFLVTDAAARLPFSTSHTTNALNHLEALWDPTLQRQVITILSRFRVPLPAPRQAQATITPFPASTQRVAHVVRASDAVTGAALGGSLTITSGNGQVLLQNAPLGQPFPFAFTPIRRRVRDPDTGGWTVELIYPTVAVRLDDASYAPPALDLGLA